nr:MAG TPA: hypothetical protein [Bacteriophage sp.]
MYLLFNLNRLIHTIGRSLMNRLRPIFNHLLVVIYEQL